MSKSKAATKGGWDAEALRAQAVAKSLQMIEMVDEADAIGFLAPNHFPAHDHLHRPAIS